MRSSGRICPVAPVSFILSDFFPVDMAIFVVFALSKLKMPKGDREANGKETKWKNLGG